MKVVVIGGSGLIGSKLVAKLGDHGHEAVAASPASGVNTLTGEGLTEVLEGADVVVDVSNSPSFETEAVLEFFKVSTRNLLTAASGSAVRHYLALSVVGTGREKFSEAGYIQAKMAQEKLITEGPLAYSIVHATQFFEFARRIADEATEGDMVRVPDALIQPMAADDVAAAVGRTAVGQPINGIVEVGGPEELRFEDFVRRGIGNDPRKVVADPQARYFGALLDERTLLPDHHATLGAIRFEDWLREPAVAG